MNDDVLKLSRARSIRCGDVRKAAALLSHGSYAVGMQMMIGLPGDTRRWPWLRGLKSLLWDLISCGSTRLWCSRKVSFRAGTARGAILPWGWKMPLMWPGSCMSLFARQGINVIRMGLQPTDELNTGAAVLAGSVSSGLSVKWFHSAMWFSIYMQRGAPRRQGIRPSRYLCPPAAGVTY